MSSLEKITIRDIRNARGFCELDTEDLVIYSIACNKYEFRKDKDGEFVLYRTWRDCG